MARSSTWNTPNRSSRASSAAERHAALARVLLAG